MTPSSNNVQKMHDGAMSGGAQLKRTLTVVDLNESRRAHALLKFFARRMIRREMQQNIATAARNGTEAMRPLVLLISPGGSASAASWLPEAEIITPMSVLPLPERNMDVQEAAFEAAEAVANGRTAPLFPSEGGVHFGDLCKTVISPYLRSALLLLRTIHELAQKHEITEIRVISADGAVARAIEDHFGARGYRISNFIPHLLRAMRTMQRGLRRISGNGRHLPSRETALEALEHVEAARRRTDVLIVSESTPMQRMFSLIEQDLHQSAPDLSVARVEYGEIGARAASNGTHVIRMQRPDVRAHARGQLMAPSRNAATTKNGSATITQRVLDVDVTLSIADLFYGFNMVLFEQQRDHVRKCSRLLDLLQPRLVVVGNDRWWIGQVFVKLAKQRGIPTLLVQDGVATDGAEWFFSTADTLALSSAFVVECFREHGREESGMNIVGQPRYDSVSKELARRSNEVRARGRKTDGRTVLFATQTMQDFDFVNSVVHALMKVDGVTILLRPHPSEDASEHRRLADKHPDRVKFVDTGDAFDTLSQSDLLVCQSSTVVLEAAMLGIPSITVNLTGMPDLAPYARRGLAVGVNSPAELTHETQRILDDPTEYARRLEVFSDGYALEAMLGPTDGRSTARATQLILRTLQREPWGHAGVASQIANRL